MDLVLWAPGEDFRDREPRTEQYHAVKKIFFEVEQRGALSLQLLQAMLLLAIYEYAHAIYPSAYITIATCARYGLILGIDKQRQQEVEQTDFDLEQQEERRRVWWAIVILDRMISQETASSPEPRPDDLLPLNDQAWDDGIIEGSHRYPVSSRTMKGMGMLARLAQASHLLGRVQRHKRSPTDDIEFNIEEQAQLNRALRAMINLTYQEGITRFMPICPQMALCFSALITLNSKSPLSRKDQTRSHRKAWPVFETGNEERDPDAVAKTLDLLRPIAQESAVTTGLYFRKQPWSLEKSSPLLLHWTYLIAVTFLRVRRSLCRSTLESGERSVYYLSATEAAIEEATRGYEAMKQKLSLLGHQWCAADAYLRILAARSTADMP